MIDVDACVMCGHEAKHGSIMLTRPRPFDMGDYTLCIGCARQIRKEQDERAQEAIRVAERAGA